VQRPDCGEVQRHCVCAANCNAQTAQNCHLTYCANDPNIPDPQGFEPCGGEITCPADGCGEGNCPDGQGGLCPKKCPAEGIYQQPCQASDDCWCTWGQVQPCPQQAACAGPFCNAGNLPCTQQFCHQQGIGCGRGAGCPCGQSRCSTSNAQFGCGNQSKGCNCRQGEFPALCAGAGTCGGWICNSQQACPSGHCEM
jgi:hypothetical protein